MKKIYAFLILISVYNQIFGQEIKFVRVYDINEKKINKGKILAINDSTIELVNNATSTVTYLNNISIIKTQRSWTRNILIGSLIGGFAGIIVGAVVPRGSIDFQSERERLYYGGMITGALGGGLISLQSKKYVINGDVHNWNDFKNSFLKRKR